MCGIVGFTGNEQAAPILLDELSKLEYRGYDSAGIAVRDGEKQVDIVKAKGRLKILAEKTNDGKAVIDSCGIGHTRWATHGEPSENNAHPHMLECKSRGAYLMGLTTFGKYNIEDTVDFTVYIPKTDPLFATSLAVIPLQLLGYYISVAKGLDVDKPRNLAKSVTVE